ncbi:MAG: hypothetical protein WBW71_07775, partial [Bacteroidota bacterium]
MKLPRIFFSPEFQDPEQNRQARLLHGFLWFVLLIVTAFAAAITIVFPSNIPRALYFVGFIVVTGLVCFPLM